MDSPAAEPPTPENLPGPETFAPEAPAMPAGIVSQIPEHLRERITIGAPAAWIVERAVVTEDDAKNAGTDPVYLLDWQHHAERQERYNRTVCRLDTLRAVQNASQWRLNFDPAMEHLTIHSLVVRRGEDAVENARTDRLRVLQREERLESLSLHGRLTVVVLLENVRSGDVLDLSFSIREQDRVFPGRFAALTTIPEWRLREFYWSVRFPKERAMRWKSNDEKLTPTIREDGEETEWSWHLSKLTGSEPEANVPSWHFTERWLQVTDFASWGEIAVKYATVWVEDFQSPEVLRLVEKIRTEADTPGKRAAKAVTFLQDEIRYLSDNTVLGGTIPTAPGAVIKRGFGDCKDKAFAAAHLLRMLGVPARPVLVNTQLRHSVAEYLPMPWVFDHAILEYEVEGKRRWVDVTVALQGGSVLTRPWVSFRLGLPIGPGVVDLEEIPERETDDLTEVKETFVIDTSGRPSTLSVVVTATGRDAERWRYMLAHDGLEAFAREREREYQQINEGTHRVGKLELHDDRANNELVLAEVYTLKSLAQPGQRGTVYYFRFAAHTIQPVLRFLESKKRKHPWAMRYPCRLRHILEVDTSTLPQNAGRSTHVDGKAFRFSCQSLKRQGIASFVYDLEVLADHVPAAEFEAHKAKVREAWAVTFVNGRVPAGSIAPRQARSADMLLPKRGRRATEDNVRPRSEAASGQTESVPETLEPVEIAPALASREGVRQEALAPRRERGGRGDGRGGDRNRVNRPNPVMAPPPVLPAGSGRSSSRSGRSERRRRRNREKAILWIGVVLLCAVVLAMFMFLLQVK